MTIYLDRFYKKLKKDLKGSLVKVAKIKELEPNAKEYLNKLAKAGRIEHVSWGWYWVPDNYRDIFDFLRKDKNFKMLSSQSAASFWNYDFIHREIYNIKVYDRSYGKALEVFARSRGWNVEVEYVENTSEIKYVRRGGIYVEAIDENIIDCLQRWAFTDAFAVFFVNKERIKSRELSKRAYWKRIARSDVRVRQALAYGAHRFNQSLGRVVFSTRKTTIKDEFVRRGVDEAVQKVVEFA
ncbi:MAG: hypothetical protein ACE5QW_07870 [Thermoplasmata archaeon]